LGHARRVLLIATELNKKGADVSVFAPRQSVQKLIVSLDLKIEFFVRDFDTLTSASALRSGDPSVLRWEERLPDLSGFDIVVSDNLPEILAIRPDAWLSGNFLWHESLLGISKSYYQRASSLLEAHEPKWLTYGGFSTIDSVKNLQITACAIPNPIIDPFEIPRDSLLITCGTAGEAELVYRNFVKSLTEDSIRPFARVFVGSNLMPQDCKRWMRPASFTATMFCKTLVAICRPGFGTVSDCLLYKIPIMAVFERGNQEMIRNAELLESAELGQAFDDLTTALTFARYYVSDLKMQEFQNICFNHFLERQYPNVADVLLGSSLSNATSWEGSESQG
jgi:hypothetical protein